TTCPPTVAGGGRLGDRERSGGAMENGRCSRDGFGLRRGLTCREADQWWVVEYGGLLLPSSNGSVGDPTVACRTLPDAAQSRAARPQAGQGGAVRKIGAGSRKTLLQRAGFCGN